MEFKSKWPDLWVSAYESEIPGANSFSVSAFENFLPQVPLRSTHASLKRIGSCNSAELALHSRAIVHPATMHPAMPAMQNQAAMQNSEAMMQMFATHAMRALL